MKKLWNSFKVFVYSYTVQMIMMIVGIIIFFSLSGIDMLGITDADIYKYMVIGSCISMIPVAIFLYKKYRIKEKNIDIKKLILMIPLGLGVSLFYNMLTINIQTPQVYDMNKYLVYFYVVLMAPIFEEIVFRYVTYNRLKENYSKRNSILLASLVFALMHSGIINIIYAFLIGVLFCYVYDRYKNILYPILVHISANLMSVFITGFHWIALIISFIDLLLLFLYFRKESH